MGQSLWFTNETNGMVIPHLSESDESFKDYNYIGMQL